MKKFTTVVLAFALLAAACGDDSAAKADPASITSCEGVADATIVLLQDVIDIFGGLDPAALGEVFAGGALPAELDEPLATSEELATRAQELSCTDFAALLAERGDQLVVAPENAIGGLIKDGVISGSEDVLSRLTP